MFIKIIVDAAVVEGEHLIEICFVHYHEAYSERNTIVLPCLKVLRDDRVVVLEFIVRDHDRRENLAFNDVADKFELIKESQYDLNLLVEITRKETENSGTELINLLQPKMTDVISLKVKPRTSVSHEFLATNMKETYDKAKSKIYRIVGD